MKIINVSYGVIVPEAPDMLQVAGCDGMSVPVGSITAEGLEAIGRAWTDGLIEKAMPEIKKQTSMVKEKIRKKHKPSRSSGEDKSATKKHFRRRVSASGYIKSNYKGVRGYRNGKWHATYYDKIKKKNVYIGLFDSELLAAAAVAEKRGDPKEARRLRNEYEEGDCMPETVDERRKAEDNKGRRGGRILPRRNSGKKSKYKGVTLKKNGKWDAVWWDGKNKRCVTVGTGFETDILAAACYQAHIGNRDEAERLCGLQEPAGNEIEQLKGPVTYMCSRCGESYDQKPNICIKCDSCAIEEVRLDAAKAAQARHWGD